MLSELGREGNEPQLLVGGPFVAGPRRCGFGSPTEQGRETGRCRSALGPAFEATSAISSPSGVASDPQLDVVIGRGGDRGTRDRSAELARELRNRRDLRQRKLLAEASSRPAAEAPRAPDRPQSGDPPCRAGRRWRAAQTERWPLLSPKRSDGLLIQRIRRNPAERALATSASVSRSNRAIARAGIGNAEQVANAGEQSRRRLRGSGEPMRSNSHDALVRHPTGARPSATSPANAAAARERLGDEIHFAFDRGRSDQLVGQDRLPHRADERALPSAARCCFRNRGSPALADGRGKQSVDLRRRPARGEVRREVQRRANRRARAPHRRGRSSKCRRH